MAFTMSRFAHLVGRPMRPSPEYVGIRSAIRFHSSSVKSPCTDRHVVEIDSSEDPMAEAYGIWSPAWRQYDHWTGNTLSTASKNTALVTSSASDQDAVRRKQWL